MQVYRIQPVGLGVNHKSEDSNGDELSLHVFDSAIAAINCEGNPKDYGDEVIEIETDSVWDNGDVEGAACDGATAVIVRRFSLNEFAKFAVPQVADMSDDEIEEEFGLPLAYADYPHWFAARKIRL